MFIILERIWIKMIQILSYNNRSAVLKILSNGKKYVYEGVSRYWYEKLYSMTNHKRYGECWKILKNMVLVSAEKI